MGVQPKTWRSGLAVAAVGVGAGLLRAFHGGGAGDWLTWACFLVGALYVFAAVADRRWGSSERPEVALGRIDRTSWLASALHGNRPLSGRRTATRDRSVTRWVGTDQSGEARPLTRHRIGNVLATVAAIIGLVLVSTGARQQGHDDDAPSTPAPPGQVAPAVPGG